MEIKDEKTNKYKKELDKQLNIMSSFGSNGFGSNGFGLIPIVEEDEDLKAEIKRLSE